VYIYNLNFIFHGKRSVGGCILSRFVLHCIIPTLFSCFLPFTLVGNLISWSLISSVHVHAVVYSSTSLTAVVRKLKRWQVLLTPPPKVNFQCKYSYVLSQCTTTVEYKYCSQFCPSFLCAMRFDTFLDYWNLSGSAVICVMQSILSSQECKRVGCHGIVMSAHGQQSQRRDTVFKNRFYCTNLEFHYPLLHQWNKANVHYRSCLATIFSSDFHSCCINYREANSSL